MVTEKKVEAIISILAEAKALHGALSSSIQTVQVEFPKVDPAIGEDRGVGS